MPDAWCLMTNHVHLLLTPAAKHSAAVLMKHLGQPFTGRADYRSANRRMPWAAEQPGNEADYFQAR